MFYISSSSSSDARIVLQIDGKGTEYKFWDFKAERAQIKSTMIDPYILFRKRGENISADPKMVSWIVEEEKEHKFWDIKAQRAQIIGTKIEVHTHLWGRRNLALPSLFCYDKQKK